LTLAFPRRIGAIILGSAFVVAACGSGATPAPSDGPDASSGPPASGAPSGVSGSITVSGSSTVEPISAAVAEWLAEANPDFTFSVEGPGTGDGFARFCAGETDISDASRAIKDAEVQTCADNGIEFVELKIAYDGLSVLTSIDNDAVACLSFADIYALVGPESQGFGSWSDAASIAAELGSQTSFPDADLTITGPGEESGTFDSFVELVITPIAKERGQDETTRPDYTSSANDNVIIEGITSSPTSFGWVGLAFAEENADVVKEIAISKEPGGECVEPNAETVSDGSYPISRPLFIYVNKAKAAENPAVAAYVDFYLAEGTISTVLERVPYVNLPADELDATRASWDAR
jgi:phosphate transport system substrate-binding protein